MATASSYFTRGELWTASPGAVDEELARLRAVGFFQLEKHEFVAGQLNVIGKVERSKKFGGTEGLRVRLRYPDNYPNSPPQVLDADHVFQPSLDGHQLIDSRLCLTFPLRGEFGLGSCALGGEVLGATLNWVIKRGIFERTNKWPEDAEPHHFGRAAAELAREFATQSGSCFVEEWVAFCLRNMTLPRIDAPCPCLSGKTIRRCHSEIANAVSQAIITSK